MKLTNVGEQIDTNSSYVKATNKVMTQINSELRALKSEKESKRSLILFTANILASLMAYLESNDFEAATSLMTDLGYTKTN